MRSGRLRSTALFQYDAGTGSDASGQPIPVWTLRAERRVSLMPITGKEFVSAQQTYGEVTHTVIVRHDSETALLTNKDRMVFAGRVFNLVHVINRWERNREIEIMAIEQIGETETSPFPLSVVVETIPSTDNWRAIVTFDKPIVAMSLNFDTWTIYSGAQRFAATGAASNGVTLLVLSEDVIGSADDRDAQAHYAPPPSDVVGVNGMTVAAFEIVEA